MFRATGESALGDDRVTSSLGTDAQGVPVAYEARVSTKGQTVQQLRGSGRPGRFSILMQTRNGESAREYLLNNGAMLLDLNIFHHFFFVPLAVEHAQLNVISPRVGQQTRFKLDLRGDETIEIGGKSVPSRHFALTSQTGATQDVWVDAKGRLLKVAIPERGLLAVRDELPR